MPACSDIQPHVAVRKSSKSIAMKVKGKESVKNQIAVRPELSHKLAAVFFQYTIEGFI